MRRTLVLAAFVAAGLGLVLAIPQERRRTGAELVRGARPFRVAVDEVRRVEVTIASLSFVAERTGDAWRLDGAPASPSARDAIEALVREIANVRAIDAFRPSSLAEFGLDPPRGTIVVTTARGVQRLALGSLNAAGSAVYARRGGHGRVLQLGVYLIEVVRRVPGARQLEGERVRGYWPEIG